MSCQSSGPKPRLHWLRGASAAALGAAALLAFIVFSYELALARVPQHRAALERLVRAQTGLDIRFNELGLRWGWYGPEAVFRHVELDEPGTSQVLLRASELVVGFDAWRTLRSGQPEAGRIDLIAPDIDFAGAGGRESGSGGGHGTGGAGSRATPGVDRMAILQRWRGGRIDVEGGTLRLPDPAGSANPFTLLIRRASLRRSDDEWSVYGLVFLPDRLGRMARVVMRVNGDLGHPATLSGSLRLEAHRLLFSGCRDFLSGAIQLARYLPSAGSGDLTMDLDFESGHIVKAGGSLRAGGLVFAAADESAAPPGGQAAVDKVAGANLLSLDRLRGDWRLARHGSDWRIRVDSLRIGPDERPASLTVDAGPSGQWVRGSLDRASLESVVAVARWLAPQLDLAGIELGGLARNMTFDWDSLRPAGERLHTDAQLENVALTPKSRDFTLSGFGVRVWGTESELTAHLQSQGARLELAQSRQYPLTDVRVASTLRVSTTRAGWQIATGGFLLEHQHARLSLNGVLRGGAEQGDPEISARGTLIGADIPLVESILGDGTAQAFGAAASQLTAGRIQNAQFELHGPISELPFGGGGDGFTGSLALQDGLLSGGGLWPDAQGVEARVEWRGARIQATITSGHAGPFHLAATRAQWDAGGQGATRLTGRVTGRLEDAIAWVREHPRLQQFAPEVQEIAASGDAAFEFDVSLPAAEGSPMLAGGAPGAQESSVQARVATFVDGARMQAVEGLPPIQAVSGSFVFDTGHLQHSTLTGTWLGGPITLRVGEHREKGARVFAVQAQGVLSAQRLANLANATATVQGSTEWTGELAYLPAQPAQPAHWRMHADSNLLGVMSSLPEPFAKRPAATVPLHFELTGANETARMRVNLGDRLRSAFALQKEADGRWTVDRGAVRFGTAIAQLPAQPVVLIQGRINRLDLPAYAMAWQHLRLDAVPAVRAQIVASQMTVAGRSYDEVTLEAERTGGGTQLQVDSAGLVGTARWPIAAGMPGTPAAPNTPVRAGGAVLAALDAAARSAQLHLVRLDLPEAARPNEGLGLIAALAPTAQLAVDELVWRGRSLGRLTGVLAADGGIVRIDDLRLVGAAHDARGSLHCQTESATCRLAFTVDSTDAAATLEDFGFRPDLAASQATLSGAVEWPLGTQRPWLETLRGTLSMRLADGTTRNPQAADAGARPFALLAVPALVSALDAPEAAEAALPAPLHELRFARLEADFDLQDGEARTSDLHFDGDAEILMRGRTGLVSRDYDQQVWVLRGEERLPAAIRRFGASPRVAAAWLSLRELFTGNAGQDRSRAVLRLQGSWDDPMVVAAN